MLSFRGASAVKVKFEITAKIEGRKSPGTLSLDWKRSNSKGKLGTASYQNGLFTWKDKIDFEIKIFNDKKDGFPQKQIFFTVFEKTDGKKQTQYKTSVDLSKFVPQDKSALPVLKDHLVPKDDGSILRITVSTKILKVKSRKSKYAQNSNGDFSESEDSGEWSFSEAGGSSASSGSEESSDSESTPSKKPSSKLTASGGSKDKPVKSPSKEGLSKRFRRSLSISSGSDSEREKSPSKKKPLPAIPDKDKVPLWKLEKLDDEAFKWGDIFLKACATWLKTHEGITTVGIFRKAGEEPKIIALRKMTGQGEFKFPDDEDPNVIASLMKRYLREMQEPLLTFDLYPKFIAIAGLPQKDLDVEILKLLNTLPENNQRLLNFLCQFFYEVSLHSETNLMTTTNLSIVVGPNVLRPKVETHETLLNDSVLVGIVVEALISRIIPGLNKRQSMQAEAALDLLHSMKRDSSEEASIVDAAPIAEQTPQHKLVGQDSRPTTADDESLVSEDGPVEPVTFRTSGARPNPKLSASSAEAGGPTRSRSSSSARKDEGREPTPSTPTRSRSTSSARKDEGGEPSAPTRSRSSSSARKDEGGEPASSTPTRQRSSSRAADLGFDFDVGDLKAAERNLRRSASRPTATKRVEKPAESVEPVEAAVEPVAEAAVDVDAEKQKRDRQLEYCNTVRDRALSSSSSDIPKPKKELVTLDLTQPQPTTPIKKNMFDDDSKMKAQLDAIKHSVVDDPFEQDTAQESKKAKPPQFTRIEDEPRPSQDDIKRKYQEDNPAPATYTPTGATKKTTGGGYSALKEDVPLVDNDKKGCCSCACTVQ